MAIANLGRAQVIAAQYDFEDYNLGIDSFLNGSFHPNGFEFEDGFGTTGVRLPNNYNAAWDSWDGWAISSMRDTATAGFGNQYSAIAGTGTLGSSSYVVGYPNYLTGEAIMHFPNATPDQSLQYVYITNSTYAYLSMLNGDSFAKQFGGTTGNDPDFFLLTIRAYENGVLKSDSVEFYLADYRFADNTQDYIVKDWTYVNLSSLGYADSLSFSLTSSDVGAVGMNTPGYFCLDELTIQIASSTSSVDRIALKAYPNPATDFIIVDGVDALAPDAMIAVFDAAGRMVISPSRIDNIQQAKLNVQGWAKGLYYIKAGEQTLPFLKN